MPSATFRALLLEGLKKFAETGYTNELDLADWLGRLHLALDREVPSDAESKELLARILGAVYKREFAGGIHRRIPGISRYQLDRIAPRLRAELDKRIFAAADLIKINKRQRVEQTLQRFAGWISSRPPASPKPDLRYVAREVGKPIAQLKYEARRVGIDQGHKLSAALAAVTAQDHGAIAGIWHDRGQYDRGYDARPEHLKRSGKLLLIRDSWAHRAGLIARRGGVQFTDEVPAPAQEPFCSCWYEYVSMLDRLPNELLTAKGRRYLAGQT